MIQTAYVLCPPTIQKTEDRGQKTEIESNKFKSFNI